MNREGAMDAKESKGEEKRREVKGGEQTEAFEADE